MPRRRTLVAAFVATTLVLGSMASASASALPGDGLYPIKRVAEQVELAFHRGLADRGAFKLELAERRLDEARALAARGPAFDELATESVREFEETAADGTADLMAAYREDHARASMVVLNQFTVRTDEVLDALASQLPSESTVALDDARERVEAIGSLSEEMCPSCGGGPEEGWTPPIDPDPVPEPESEPPPPAEPPAEPSLPVPPGSVPLDTTSTSSEDEDEDEEEEEEEESEDTDSDEPELPAPTPTPTPTPEPTPTPTPSPEPTPCPTPTPLPEPAPAPTPTPTPCPTPEPTEPPEPTDPPPILPEIIPETLDGVGQLISGTL